MAIDIDNLYSHNLADKSIDEIDRWLRQTYGMAWNELSKTIDEYVARVEKQDAEKRKQVENGTLSVDEYKQWRIRRTNDDKRWNTLKESIAQKITQTNIIASDYINGKTPEVYASAHNFMNYEYEQNTGISFTVVNKEAIKAMALGKNVTQFKTLKVNAKRDYKWNQDRIQKALMSGIVQGKSMPKIANDFYQIMGSNKKSALRNARTAVTSAQNCGYNDSMVELLKMGIKFHKKWVSAHDNRVRDSHAQLDGVLVEPDEKFPNGLLYPADPQGEPSEVYNCRCRMTASLDDYREDEREIREYYIDENGKRRSRVVKVKADKHTKETYNQWLKRKSANNLKSGGYVSSVRLKALNAHVEYNKPSYLPISERTDESIIKRIGVLADEYGCCTSLAFAYVGNKSGLNVVDSRMDKGTDLLQNSYIIEEIAKINGVSSRIIYDKDDFKIFNEFEKSMKEGKEYLVAIGEHTSIIKKVDGKLNFLELQRPKILKTNKRLKNGWHLLNDSRKRSRFNCSNENDEKIYPSVLIECESMYDNEEIELLMGFINKKR